MERQATLAAIQSTKEGVAVKSEQLAGLEKKDEAFNIYQNITDVFLEKDRIISGLGNIAEFIGCNMARAYKMIHIGMPAIEIGKSMITTERAVLEWIKARAEESGKSNQKNMDEYLQELEDERETQRAEFLRICREGEQKIKNKTTARRYSIRKAAEASAQDSED